MSTGLSWNFDAIDHSNGVIQLLAVILKPALYGPSAVGHAAVRGLDELHVLRYEREEVVPPVVLELAPSVRHAAVVGLVRRDLARVHRVFHERRPDEHARCPVGVRERSLARPLDAGERGSGHAQRDAIPGRRHLRWHCRRRGRGRVTWGRLVLPVGLRIPQSAASLLGQL